MKKISILFLFLSLSCNHHPSHLEKLLIQSNWSYIDNYKFNPNSKFTTYTLFKKDGQCIDYVFGLGEKYNSGEWNYNPKDSILKIHDIEFKVLGVEKDTIRLNRTERNYGAMLINVSTLSHTITTKPH